MTSPVIESVKLPWVGRVKQTSNLRGLLQQHPNQIVDVGVELMAQALMGGDLVSAVLFGYTNGIVVTPGLRSIYNPVARASVGPNANVPSFISKDDDGFSSICNWTATLTNPGPSNLSYDMLGLVSQNDRLLAATSNFGTVTLVANETIAVQWTILLRG